MSYEFALWRFSLYTINTTNILLKCFCVIMISLLPILPSYGEYPCVKIILLFQLLPSYIKYIPSEWKCPRWRKSGLYSRGAGGHFVRGGRRGGGVFTRHENTHWWRRGSASRVLAGCFFHAVDQNKKKKPSKYYFHS